MTREVHTTRRFSKKDPFSILGFQSLLRNDRRAQQYVKSTIDIVRTDGMKLLEEYSPEISYLSMTRFKGVKDFTLGKFKGELEKVF